MKHCMLFISITWFMFSTMLFSGETVPITVQTISGRVINFRVGDPPEFGSRICNNVVAVKTDIGLVIIDSGYYPQSASKIRELAVAEFGTDKIAYVINTHWHWDHISGNQAFSDVPVIAHQNIIPAMQLFEQGLTFFKEQRKERVDSWTKRLRQTEPGSDEKLTAMGWIYAHQHFIDELSRGLKVIYPTLTFSDQLTIHGGTITLKLYHVPLFHSDNDIIVHIPEENVLVSGDLFYHGSLPSIKQSAIGFIPQWIDIFESILSENRPVNNIIPGHGEFISVSELDVFQNYLKTIISEKEIGQNPQIQSEESSGLATKYKFLTNIYTESKIISTHNNNIKTLSMARKKPAILILKQLFKEINSERVQDKFNKTVNTRALWHVDKNEFIDFGYDLFMFGSYKKAIICLTILSEFYYKDWDVWDFLGEIHAKAGNRGKAFACFKRSLELNPENQNAKTFFENFK